RLAIHDLSATPARATAAYRTRRDDDGVRATKPYRTDDRGRHPLACARTRHRAGRPSLLRERSRASRVGTCDRLLRISRGVSRLRTAAHIARARSVLLGGWAGGRALRRPFGTAIAVSTRSSVRSHERATPTFGCRARVLAHHAARAGAPRSLAAAAK